MRNPEYIEKGYVSEVKTTVSGVPYTWRFKPAAATMGFGLNDKAIATMAKEMGKEEDYQKYEKRSKNWKNVWNMDIESEGFKGFPQNPNPDGTFEDYVSWKDKTADMDSLFAKQIDFYSNGTRAKNNLLCAK